MMQGKWITGSNVTIAPGSTAGGSVDPSATPYDRCHAFASCNACSSAAAVDGTSCGWCQYSGTEGICSSGSATGVVSSSGSTGSCADWRFGTCAVPPPPPGPPPACPIGLSAATCSGHGSCSTSTYTCSCATGWKGEACEYDCSNKLIPNPSKDGKPVSHCQYSNPLNCGSQDWVADRVCQAQYGSTSTHVSSQKGSCASGGATYWGGSGGDSGTCNTHWWNLGDCQCYPIVNVYCTNPASYCHT